MVVFPTDKPVIRGIHSGYVDMAKLLSHYRKQVGSGCIHCKSKNLEGVLFFDPEKIINGFLNDAARQLHGSQAIDRLIAAAADQDMVLGVYEIAADQRAFWAGMQSATAIHSNLSTDFTDLFKLLKKMTAEKLTGFIDVALDGRNEAGRIFLMDGKFIGGTYSETGGGLLPSEQHLNELIAKTANAKGTFNVFSIAAPPAKKAETKAPPEAEVPHQGIAAMAELLALTEQVVAREKKTSTDFQTLLKKQFIDKVDQYPFLDPFAAELEYRDGEITFSGQVEESVFVKGIFASAQGLVHELDLNAQFSAQLALWRQRYAQQLELWGVSGPPSKQ
ncbi:MAG: hypothetical protein WAU91_04395 [Desulfatitalea sp.]